MRFKNGDEFVVNREASAVGRYKFNDKNMPGVTTVLNEQSKRYLIDWAAKSAYEDSAGKTKEQIESIVRNKQYAHLRKSGEAKDDGSDAHEIVEKFIKDYIDTKEYKVPTYEGYNDGVRFSVERFVKWAIDNKVEFTQSEISVCNPEEWYAGSFDFIAKINGKWWLGDFKTSKQIDSTYYGQGAAYIKAVNWIQKVQGEAKTEFAGVVIIKSTKSKEDVVYFKKKSGGGLVKEVIPAFEVSYTENVERHWGYFLAMLYAYRYNKDYEVKNFTERCVEVADWDGVNMPEDIVHV